MLVDIALSITLNENKFPKKKDTGACYIKLLILFHTHGRYKTLGLSIMIHPILLNSVPTVGTKQYERLYVTSLGVVHCSVLLLFSRACAHSGQRTVGWSL